MKALTKKQMIDAAKKHIADNGINLVTLEGSEKQIAWASDLRYTAIGAILQFGNPKPQVFDVINKKASAKWWIDNDVNVSSPRCIIAQLMK